MYPLYECALPQTTIGRFSADGASFLDLASDLRFCQLRGGPAEIKIVRPVDAAKTALSGADSSSGLHVLLGMGATLF